MTVLWTRNEAAKATGGRHGDADWAATGVSIDSRTLKPGDLFVALAGPNFDGHEYVAAALAAGAAAALVHRIPEGCDTARLLIVPDTLAGLGALGAFARARTSARIIGVTGSVGKTSAKEMLKRVLSDQGATHASEGSLNNHWGVPLSLARMPADCAFAILEMGMNHAGELTPLSLLARPHVAVVTTVEAVHCEFFASIAEIADAKAEIFAGLEAGGTVVLNRDNPFFERLSAAARAAGAGRVDSFGWHIESAARLLDCALDPKNSSVFALVGDDTVAYRLSVPGLQWVMNSLCVLLAARAAGADLARAAASLAHMQPPHGRGERFCLALPGGSVEIIDESYNASPVSMRAAFHTLALAKPAKGARRIAVLGDMLELGAHAESLHASLAAPLAERGIDLVFTAGAHMRTLHEALPPSLRGGHADSSDLLAPRVKASLLPGDVVMVKGSAGSRMGRVVKVLLGEA
ncbi:MAG: UDP-N-acetylmuramoylalanyl-D-glutamyl-2,6-diaminopimelate--D-alanyl-D-alanine ligase [Alphaproteobacteria bacterium]|nr:UDP-N-acetylmuramoylalanyl-D-glutamyl-2,6-diaminopimelate--D-alanyl-D-alanine ligase [Alphaproteobacteria bacterium]